MSTAPSIARVLCNGAQNLSKIDGSSNESTLELNYQSIGDTERNVNLALPDFVRGLYYLPDRILDLLELAAYIYCADRRVRRGETDALEYHGWARSFEFVMRVRDFDFWSSPAVQVSLSGALKFMSGDRDYLFSFQPGHATPPTNLFDSEAFVMESSPDLSVILFSGGLDSLAGALERLVESDDQVCLVSHQSQPGTIRTQNSLVQALQSHYPGRVMPYGFGCNLRKPRAAEESQRTRMFLYSSIAFAIARAFSQSNFYIYENGVTGINFPRRENLSNARATRTAHPQTIRRLEEFFSLLAETPIAIQTPFLWKTKSDVFEMLSKGQHPELVPSSVSCSRTFQNLGQATHCGLCSQCVDRRFAAYGARAEDLDEFGTYSKDIINREIEAGQDKTTAVDYMRQARDFATWNVDHFYQKMLSELSMLIDWLPDCENENDAVERVWDLCRRHGQQVSMAIRRMRDAHDDPYQQLAKSSLLELISNREHFVDPVERLAESIIRLVSPAIPNMFRGNPPKNEPDLNQKVGALLDSHLLELRSEHPAVSFACANVVPDHTLLDLLIESKYIRQGTPPSKASEGIAADLTKYPGDAFKLFLVYDPAHAIPNDRRFQEDFESKGRCIVCILR